MKLLVRESGGFTLVELMFAVSLSTVIGMVIFLSARTGEQQINSREIRMTIQDNAREGLYKMTQELRQSSPDRITIGNNGQSISFDVPDPDSLVNDDYSLNWDDSHTVEYALSDGQIIRTDSSLSGNAATTVIANDVTSINFSSNDSLNRITITMAVQRQLANGRMMPDTPLSVTAQAEVRNS